MVVKLRLEMTNFTVNVRVCKPSRQHIVLNKPVNMNVAISSHIGVEANITV